MSSSRRVYATFAVLVAAVAWAFQPVRAALPDYKLGEIATEDVVTSVGLLVVNPEATETLKQKVSQQVQFIVRQTTPSAGEAEAELRESIAVARRNFMASLQRALNDRPPVEADANSAAFATTIRDVARESPKDLPLDQLAPLWIRGASDTALVDSLILPVREVMLQPIVASKTDTTFPAGQSLRLISMKSTSEVPNVRDLENAGQIVSVGRIISLWRARRLVEASFQIGQEQAGRFAASFVRTNAYPDPALTEILRAKRVEGVTVNDTYEAAQVIVRKGQVIDRKALSAMAAMREKSLIGTLQTKLEQEQTVTGETTRQTKWIVASLGLLCMALVGILWRLSARPAPSLLPALAGESQAALPGGESDATWRDRAMLAEGKAERAHEAIRTGVLGWMRDKFFRALFQQRAELLSVQQKAQAEMGELELRMEQLHTPLQERIDAYEKRIAALETELAAKGEENRELLGARIRVTRQRLSLERERGRFGSN